MRGKTDPAVVACFVLAHSICRVEGGRVGQLECNKRCLEEQKAQKQDRFLRGRQMAYLIYEYFRVTGANTVRRVRCGVGEEGGIDSVSV